MKVLFDVGHPENVHIFKHLAWRLDRDGHSFVFTARDKDLSVRLLQSYHLPVVNFGRHYKTVRGKLLGLALFDMKMARVIVKEKPDLLVSHGSMYAAHAGWLLGCPHVSLEDTDDSMEQIRLYAPFTGAILTPRQFRHDLGKRHIRYDGYHELAYLHPNVLSGAESDAPGRVTGRKRVLIRLTAWEASHDRGHAGLNRASVAELIEELSTFVDVFVSAEGATLETAGSREVWAPEDIHSFLATLDLYIGEGATMASECSVLGVPSIYVNSQVPSYIEEQSSRFGLVRLCRKADEILREARRILSDPGAKDGFRRKKEALLRSKIDVHEFLYWFITTYPRSLYEAQADNSGVMARFGLPDMVGGPAVSEAG